MKLMSYNYKLHQKDVGKVFWISAEINFRIENHTKPIIIVRKENSEPKQCQLAFRQIKFVLKLQ